jgi:hypothetical protein
MLRSLGTMNRKLIILSLLVGAQVLSRAATFEYAGFLNGPSEVTPNSSPGTGSAHVTYDDVAHTLHLQTSFSGLEANTTAAHIHAPTAAPFSGGAGVATTVPTFAGFPLGVTSGDYDITLDLTLASSYNPSFVTANGGIAGAEVALVQAIADGKAYLNIHSQKYQGGEIRAFFATPDGGATFTLLFGALAGGFAFRRFQKR